MNTFLEFLFAHLSGLLDHLCQSLIQIGRGDLLGGQRGNFRIGKDVDPHDVPAAQFNARAAQTTGVDPIHAWAIIAYARRRP